MEAAQSPSDHPQLLRRRKRTCSSSSSSSRLSQFMLAADPSAAADASAAWKAHEAAAAAAVVAGAAGSERRRQTQSTSVQRFTAPALLPLLLLLVLVPHLLGVLLASASSSGIEADHTAEVVRREMAGTRGSGAASLFSWSPACPPSWWLCAHHDSMPTAGGSGSGSAAGLNRKLRMMTRRALQSSGASGTGAIIGAVFGGLLGVTMVLIAVFLCRCIPPAGGRSGKVADPQAAGGNEKGNKAEEKGKGEGEQDGDVHVWSIQQVQAATDSFSSRSVLEDVGHSTVYLGVMPDGARYAIKRAKKVLVEGGQLFQNEVDFLDRLRHENLPKLCGFCEDDGEQIVVFNYAENGALCDWLRPKDPTSRPALTFEQRLRIARDMGRALKFLHTLADPVIHRDVKSETILLDHDFNALVGGLGMLKHLPGEAMRIRMARKKGYLDPEYFQLFKVTSKCDVYSLGVVILELITARMPVVSEEDVKVGSRVTKRVITLAQWALPKVEDGELDSIVDPRLKEGEGYPADVMQIFAGIAMMCVIPLRKNRPDINRVAAWLEDVNQPDPASLPSLAAFAKRPSSNDSRE